MIHREIGKEEEDEEDYADDVDDDGTDGTMTPINAKPSMSDQKIIGKPSGYFTV